MLLRTTVSLALFTFLANAADPAAKPQGNDIFSVRSFAQRETKAKVPVTDSLFTDGKNNFLSLKGPGQELLSARVQAGSLHQCAIPLLEAKPRKTNDPIAKFLGPNRSPSPGTMPPPIPACRNWR